MYDIGILVAVFTKILSPTLAHGMLYTVFFGEAFFDPRDPRFLDPLVLEGGWTTVAYEKKTRYVWIGYPRGVGLAPRWRSCTTVDFVVLFFCSAAFLAASIGDLPVKTRV